MTVGPTNSGFGSDDIAESVEQRAREEELRKVDPNALGRYETAIPNLLPPKVIVLRQAPVVPVSVAVVTATIAAGRYHLIHGMEEEEGRLLIHDRETERIIGYSDETHRPYIEEMIRRANRMETT